MFPWVSKSSFLAVAFSAFVIFLLSAAYLLYFTSRTELKVTSLQTNTDCTRLSDVSGSLANIWPPTHLTFADIDARTPIDEEPQSKWLAWWDDNNYRIHLDLTWPAELEDGQQWTQCSITPCRLTHAVDHSGTEFFMKADSNADPQIETPFISLHIYNFPGQSEPILSLRFEYKNNVLIGELTRDGSTTFYEPGQFFSQTIVLNLKFYSDQFEVWISVPAASTADGNIGDASQSRAFLLTNYPFSGPYWIFVDDINGGNSENEAYWTVEGTAQPPATQDYLRTESSTLTLHSMYFESESHCEQEALSICSSLAKDMEIQLTSGRYGESICYSASGESTYYVNNSMGSIHASWTDVVWQGRDINSALGWDAIFEELIPRAQENSYSELAAIFTNNDWYTCGYKSVPLWIDCLQDTRCVFEENGIVKKMGFEYTVSSAINQFGSIPCIERITETQLFVKRTALDNGPHNCIAAATLTTMDWFLEIPGAMNKWWGCESYASVEECLTEPHRGQEQCVHSVSTFPSSLQNCEHSDYDCSVVTKFDGLMSIQEYQEKYSVDLSMNITGQALFNFTHLYITPHDQCQIIDEQLCNEQFTSALCSNFAGPGPYLCDTDKEEDYLAVGMESAGIAALFAWLVLFCLLMYQTWCCCSKRDVLLEKQKALEKRKREKRRKRRKRKQTKAEEAAKNDQNFQLVNVDPIKAEPVSPPLQIQVALGHDIPDEGHFDNHLVVNDPLQVQELEDLANGTLPLLYSDYSQQSYQNNHSPHRQPGYSNHEMYNPFSPHQNQDLAYEEFGDNPAPYQNYYSDPDSLPSEYRTPDFLVGHTNHEFASIPTPHVRRSPLESRFLSDRSSTLTTTATNPEMAAFYARQQRMRELEHELEGIDEMLPTVKIEITEANVEEGSDSEPSSLSEFNENPSLGKIQLSNPSSKAPSWTDGRSDNFVDKLAPIPYHSTLQDAIDNYDQSSSVVKRYSHSGSSARAAAKSPEPPIREEEAIEKLRRIFSSASQSKSADRDLPGRTQSFGSPRKPPKAAVTSFDRRHSVDSPRVRNQIPVPDSSPPKPQKQNRLPRANNVQPLPPRAIPVQPHTRIPTPIHPISITPENPVLNISDPEWVPSSIPRRRSEQTDQGVTSSFKTSSYMPSTPQDQDDLSSLPDSEEGHSRKGTDSRKNTESSHQLIYDPDPSPWHQFRKVNQFPEKTTNLTPDRSISHPSFNNTLKTINETKPKEMQRKKPNLAPLGDSWWSRFEKLNG